MNPQLVQCEFCIPVVRSDMGPQRQSSWKALVNALCSEFPPEESGFRTFYKDDIRMIAGHRCRQYYIAVPFDRTMRLKLLLRQAIGNFNLKSLYFCCKGEVEFLTAPDDFPHLPEARE